VRQELKVAKILRMVNKNITWNTESDKVCSSCDGDKEMMKMSRVQIDTFDIKVRPP